MRPPTARVVADGPHAGSNNNTPPSRRRGLVTHGLALPGHAQTQRKAALLAERFPLEKPRHREIVRGTIGGESVAFCAGKFLNSLARHFIGRVVYRPLDAPTRATLVALPWFESWLRNLQASRKGCNPTAAEQVEAVLAQGIDPRSVREVSMARTDGTSCTFDVRNLLNKVAYNFVDGASPGRVAAPLPSELRARVRNCRWAAQWIANSRQARAGATDREVVTKETKLSILANRFAERKPTDADAVCVYVAGTTTPIVFYPSRWLGASTLRVAQHGGAVLRADVAAVRAQTRLQTIGCTRPARRRPSC